MSTVFGAQNRRKKIVFLAACVFLLIALITAMLFVRQRFGLRTFPRHIWHLTQAVLNKEDAAQLSTGNYDNIIFLHHSTGDNLIKQGSVRELLSDSGFKFWDQSYNHLGLRDPEGNLTGYSYSVPRDNTDPDGLAVVFQQTVYDLPVNTLSGLLQHEVIIFKSCFAPTSNIASDAQLQQYKEYYSSIRDKIDQYPDKLFILVNQPPLNPAETNPDEARRARILADWLLSEEYLGGRSNLYAFDLFSYVAEDDPESDEYNMLAKPYRNGKDSHPNKKANQELGPIFAEYIEAVVQQFRTD